MKLAYSYDPISLKFVGIAPMQPHPTRPGEYLVPAHSTLVEPPSDYTPMQTPIYNLATKTWSLVQSDLSISIEKERLNARSLEGNLLYEYNLDGELVERDPAIVKAEDDAKKEKRDYNNNVRELKMTMDRNIFLKGQEVTKGSGMTEVQTFITSFQLKRDNASEYINDGLLVRYPWGLYEIGDPLNMEQKIYEYYNGVLVMLDKFRDAEIAAYLTAKAALGPDPNQ